MWPTPPQLHLQPHISLTLHPASRKSSPFPTTTLDTSATKPGPASTADSAAYRRTSSRDWRLPGLRLRTSQLLRRAPADDARRFLIRFCTCPRPCATFLFCDRLFTPSPLHSYLAFVPRPARVFTHPKFSDPNSSPLFLSWPGALSPSSTRLPSRSVHRACACLADFREHLLSIPLQHPPCSFTFTIFVTTTLRLVRITPVVKWRTLR